MINQIFQLILSFFVGLMTVRYLGPTNYGAITYIASYISFFSSICILGLDTVVVNRLVNYQDRDGEIIGTAIFLRSIVSIICMGTLSFVIYIVDHGDGTLMKVAFLSGFELLFKAFGTIGFWYQYKLLSKKTAIADMVSFVIASAYRVWLLMAGKDIYWFAFYNSLIFLLAALIYVPMFRKDCENRIFVSREMSRDLLKSCVPYLISGVMVSLYTQVDRIMIKQILGSTTEVGYYAAAVTICNLIAFIPSSISLSSRPILMQMKRDHAVDYNKRVTQVLAAIIWFSIFYSLFVTIFAQKIITVLYGNAYIYGTTTLRLLVWCTIFENLTKIRDMWLIGENQSRWVTLFSLIGTITNIVANYFLIHQFGIEGAAIATVMTQALVTLVVPAVSEKTRMYTIDVLCAITLHKINVKELTLEVRNAMKGKKTSA